MEDIKDKLGYLSFAEKSWEELDRSLHLLRDVKLKFCRCGESCFTKEEVPLNSWRSIRTACLSDCQAAHNSIFDIFSSKFIGGRDDSVKCVYSCHTEFATSKFGEEDQTICEEKCYEEFWRIQKQLNQELQNQYEKVYLKKFTK